MCGTVVILPQVHSAGYVLNFTALPAALRVILIASRPVCLSSFLPPSCPSLYPLPFALAPLLTHPHGLYLQPRGKRGIRVRRWARQPT